MSKYKKKCFEVAKPKQGGWWGGGVAKLFSHISVLSTRRPSSMQSAVAGCVFCVRVHVCVWATLCLWFTAPPTLSPLSVCWSTAMVKEATIQCAINLDTSYLCLPLQGEVCPVTNMINPLPLCWQPPAHPTNLHPPFPNKRPVGKKTGPPPHLRGIPIHYNCWCRWVNKNGRIQFCTVPAPANILLVIHDDNVKKKIFKDLFGMSEAKVPACQFAAWGEVFFARWWEV